MTRARDRLASLLIAAAITMLAAGFLTNDLYLAALRLSKEAGVRQWYEAKKRRDGEEAKRAVVAVMRKLVLALYQVGVKGAAFEASRLYGGKSAGVAEQDAGQ